MFGDLLVQLIVFPEIRPSIARYHFSFDFSIGLRSLETLEAFRLSSLRSKRFVDACNTERFLVGASKEGNHGSVGTGPNAVVVEKGRQRFPNWEILR